MNEAKKVFYAKAYAMRGAQFIKFVREYFRDNPWDDEPFLRPVYALLSMGFELLLKSRLIMLNISVDQLKNELGHDFSLMFSSLGADEAKRIGIESINKEKDVYLVKVVDSKIVRLWDITDVRYGKKLTVVKHQEITEYADCLIKIWPKIQSANEFRQ